jgi:cell volume regulation protein A
VTNEQLGVYLLLGGIVLLCAVVAVRLSTKTGLPSLLLYLALGLLIGEGGLGVNFDDAHLTTTLGYIALILILAEGGITTDWPTIRPVVAPAALLATVGTGVSIAVAGYAAHAFLDLSWSLALLLGAAIASTDAAAVFSVLRRVPLPPRLVGMLEAESGFNDAPVVIAVVAMTEVALGHDAHAWPYLLGEAAAELAIGAVVGVAVGWLGSVALRRVALPAAGLYPIAVLGLAVGAYGAADVAHGSGFLATYLASLVLGNVRLPHGAAVRGFAEAFGWLAQIGLFVLLGLLAAPSRLAEQLVPALLTGLVLLLVARPASVLVSVSWFRIPVREQAFLSWAGLRGAVPVVLATVPVAAGVPGATRLFDLVFVLVVVFTLVQAPSLPWVARRLGLTGSLATVGLNVESSPLGALGADVLEVTVGPESRLHGVEVFELRLPAGANVTLVVREHALTRGNKVVRRTTETFVPTPRTMLRHGDTLIVVTTAVARAETEARLTAVSAGGKLAKWSASGERVRGFRRIGGRGARRGIALGGWRRPVSRITRGDSVSGVDRATGAMLDRRGVNPAGER